ncbi:MAG: hypothetical protein JWN08_2689 [Frankiales bacterium]|nr:hypothetical protein [Frankiales bacterium]
MRVQVRTSSVLRFDDGEPVRAASAVVRHRGGWLVVQDDATHAAWWHRAGVDRLRVLPPVDGLDLFDEASGTKHLKPDLEAACAVPGGVLLLGSGSTPARTRGALLLEDGSAPQVLDLAVVQDAVAEALGLPRDQLNLEGACLVGGAVRWFQRGSGGRASGSVDLQLAALLQGRPEVVASVQRLELPLVDGVALAVTDAVALPGGLVLVSATAEDTPNAVDDGLVVATALAVLDADGVRDLKRLPEVDGAVRKVEGLALESSGVPAGGVLRLLAVVDADDPDQPSQALRLEVSL